MLFTGNFLDSSLVKEKKKKNSLRLNTIGASPVQSSKRKRKKKEKQPPIRHNLCRLNISFFLLFSVPKLSKSDFLEQDSEARRSNRFE